MKLSFKEKKSMKSILLKPLNISLIFVALFAILLTSCEDSALIEYKEEFFIEGFLFVDQPIENIIVMRSQPITDTFRYEQSLVRNANVVVREKNGESFQLQTQQTGSRGYFYANKDYLVKPDTEYELEITLPNGNLVTGTTLTPPRSRWLRTTSNPLQYPSDTASNRRGDTLRWERVSGYPFYVISVRNLDTLNYGKYLNPPTDELNSRVPRDFGSENIWRDNTSLGLIANNESPVVWFTFRWFGLHEVSIFVPDFNMLQWFLQVQSSREYIDLLESVQGNAVGAFGSAYAIRDTVMLLKP